MRLLIALLPALHTGWLSMFSAGGRAVKLWQPYKKGEMEDLGAASGVLTVLWMSSAKKKFLWTISRWRIDCQTAMTPGSRRLQGADFSSFVNPNVASNKFPIGSVRRVSKFSTHQSPLFIAHGCIIKKAFYWLYGAAWKHAMIFVQ